jgi:hypothetical protein
MRWIALRYRGKDYEYDEKEAGGAEGGLPGAPQPVHEPGTLGGVLARVEAVLGYFGIWTNRGRYYSTPMAVSADILANATFAGDGLYYIEMRGKKPLNGKLIDCAHALAIQHEGSGAVFRFFDSNEGHFVIRGPAPVQEVHGLVSGCHAVQARVSHRDLDSWRQPAGAVNSPS